MIIVCHRLRMKVIDKQLLFISSEERDGGTISDFTISMPSHLIACTQHQRMRMVLNDVVMPYTWYNVQETNRTFMIQELHNDPNHIQIDLDEGSYHVLQLRDHINTKLAALALQDTYNVTYDEVSSKFTITAQHDYNTYVLHLI